jgi:hypothetical protein
MDVLLSGSARPKRQALVFSQLAAGQPGTFFVNRKA